MEKVLIKDRELILAIANLDGIWDGDEKDFFTLLLKRIKKENKNISFNRDMVFFLRVDTFDGGGCQIYTVDKKGKIEEADDTYWDEILPILRTENFNSTEAMKNNKKFETYFINY